MLINLLRKRVMLMYFAITYIQQFNPGWFVVAIGRVLWTELSIACYCVYSVPLRRVPGVALRACISLCIIPHSVHSASTVKFCAFVRSVTLAYCAVYTLSLRQHRRAVVLETTVAAESEDITQKELLRPQSFRWTTAEQSGEVGEGRELMLAVHHQSHFNLLIEASKIDLCKCKGNCGAMCGCRKAGMKCSAVCFHCSGETCSNVMELSELINENDFDDEPPTLTPLPSPVLHWYLIQKPDQMLSRSLVHRNWTE
ncbi:hypothetical protein EVAR_69892_1 [Eumeta japonica]|uniref:Tesmin/TSO1-like CXC domain-containing protein n=1 Tax=Eumeta variegata TaxID=151549 RepID=A0A4C1ZW07_EUMVA|nr:hypothetical protein EVAR_69892_1 [Eumeta japonica]